EQEVRAASQVEAKIDGLLRQPARQGIDYRARQHAGDRQQRADDQHAENENDLPFWEVEHGGLCRVPLQRPHQRSLAPFLASSFFTGSGLLGTALTASRTILTFTPSAISTIR